MKTAKYLIALLMLICSMPSIGQRADNIPLIAADKSASGNYKDVLTSFFQLAVKNLTGPDKAVGFSSNLFGIMVKANPNLVIDTSYIRHTFHRRFNISISAAVDSNYRLNGFSSGIKYAIVDKRDFTVSRDFLSQSSRQSGEFRKLGKGLNKKIELIEDDAIQESFLKEKEKFIRDSTVTFDALAPDFKEMVLQIAKDSNLVYFIKLVAVEPKFNALTKLNEGVEKIKNDFQNKALWTIGISDTAHNSGKLFKSVEINSQFLKGIINPKSKANLELDIKATASFLDDSLKTGKNLNRQVFVFEPGLNLVLKGKNNQSYLEFKLSGSYINVWKGVFAKENKITNTINGTIRLRVLDELWIPLKITYDTKNGNVFGFLNLVTNFTGIGKFLNPKNVSL
jgi:hypothetical protein